MVPIRLIDALRIIKFKDMAFVGAGGKTTAMFRAARELSYEQDRSLPQKSVLITTTTHLGAWQARLADQVICINSAMDLQKIEKQLPAGISLLIREETNNRLSGFSEEILNRIHEVAEERNLPLLIEADGSSSRPLKAPAEYEPAIPEFSKNVIVVAGLAAIGKPLLKEWVHRPELFAELSGLSMGDEITDKAIIRVLQSSEGGLKKIPPNARKLLILNQGDSIHLQAKGRAISNQLLGFYPTSIITSLGKSKIIGTESTHSTEEGSGEIFAVVEKIAGIILAAGESSRFGEPKQLLSWKGEPFIRHVVTAAMKAGLSPIIVVVGSSGQEIEKVLSDMPLRIVVNAAWMTGISSSIRLGLSEVPQDAGGALFLLSDQPQVSHMLIKKIIEAHQETLAPITAPQINGQKGNPVLFDRKAFTNLFSLQGDIGGRVLFSKFTVQWVIWHEEDQLLDVDTRADYQRFLKLFTKDEEMT